MGLHRRDNYLRRLAFWPRERAAVLSELRLATKQLVDTLDVEKAEREVFQFGIG
jgi:hypothetical protein